ncbi:adenylate/guanylate cyclase domain-containing protein [Laspinema olomoucense]|uniref:HAMP domain-containing protein n=1 Tax=Laspinema olomoucense D3b TaxID=2953688 RepID=A0ABT2NC12_9CYAN|nr:MULTISPECIES: adenylate/guanylate cyclase domain-containing protein [unclassified Laspinema]MCT7980102.1 HAMP domain-containing protein [Laspinema sp. D3b]MCT7996379.1 HAMP domain-containing protein [Laspinema sp. D3c]
MTLRKKTLLAIGMTLAGLFGVVHLTSSTILLNGFTALEQKEARRNVKRVLDAFSNYQQELQALNFQWGVWDETYRFIQNGNLDYIDRNLGEVNLASLRANAVLFINQEGKLVFGQGFDLVRQRLVPIPAEVSQKITETSIQVLKPKESLAGIVTINNRPMTLAAGPILNSQGNLPSRGTLAIARFLDREEIQRLAKLTHLDVRAYGLMDPTTPVELQPAIARLSQMSDDPPILIEPLNQEWMAGYSLLRDIYGQPAVLLELNIPREIFHQGQASARYMMVSLAIVGLVFGFCTLLLLEKMVLARLSYLSQDVKKIDNRRDLTLRVSISGKDELSSLGQTINAMLETLESSANALAIEREKAESLLLNILPEVIADRLKGQEENIADTFAEVTVLFADIVGFTQLSAQIEAAELVHLLNNIFSRFDRALERYQLEKIKTIGDCYMVVAGMPVPCENSAVAIAEMALEMQEEIARFNAEFNQSLKMRMGIHTGPVVAGVIGIKKFIYDLWGDTVNTASRMESHGIPGQIQVSEATYNCLKDQYRFEARGAIEIKGKGAMQVYLLKGRL